VTPPVQLDFPDASALAVEVDEIGSLPAAVHALGLITPRPAVVIVGGASGLDQTYIDRLERTFASGIVPVLERQQAVAIDGGTDSGVMRLGGEVRASLGASYPLVGVAAIGTVRIPGRLSPTDDAAALEPHHSHFVLVPGDSWGAEVPWIARTASAVARGSPTVTVLMNGGRIAFDDVEHSVRADRQVIVVAGSGRTADALAGALDGRSSDQRERALAASGLISAVPIDAPAVLADLLDAILRGSPAQ
jgi:SLOG in TRPM, prokaryote